MDALKVCQVFTCSLPCKEFFKERKVVLFTYIDAAGEEPHREHWAEASPLPGRSQETCEDVLHALQNLKQGKIPPSLEFALDILPPLDKPITICRLLAGSPKEILQKAEKLHSEGAAVVKVKVANLAIQEAVALIKELKQTFRLRIDANRQWDLKEALLLARHFSPDDPAIEFFEEPLRLPDELRSFPLPFALDESLVEPEVERLLQFPNLRFLVLKPTILGGKKGCLEWMEKCPHLQFVISSAFESGVGILQLARLAKLLSCEYAGLDSYSYLADDVLTTPLELRGGMLIPQQVTVRRGILCPI